MVPEHSMQPTRQSRLVPVLNFSFGFCGERSNTLRRPFILEGLLGQLKRPRIAAARRVCLIRLRGVETLSDAIVGHESLTDLGLTEL